MTRDELLTLHVGLTEDALEIMRAKNHDYTGGSGDPFLNFRAAEYLGIDARLGLLLRMMDKVQRLRTAATSTLQVKEETWKDAVLDIINYAVLYAGLSEEKMKLKVSTPLKVPSSQYGWLLPKRTKE